MLSSPKERIQFWFEPLQAAIYYRTVAMAEPRGAEESISPSILKRLAYREVTREEGVYFGRRLADSSLYVEDGNSRMSWGWQTTMAEYFDRK